MRVLTLAFVMAAQTAELVDSTAIAERFGVTVQTVRRWVRDGVIPCIRPTRRIVRFRLDDVEKSFSRNAGYTNDDDGVPESCDAQ